MKSTARQRIGSEMPYRDDPSAPPSARLESFTPGGFGYSSSDYEKPKDYPLHRRALQTAVDVLSCHACCGDIATATNNAADDPNSVYYEDSFNDLSWSCSIGTSDEHGIWLNQSDTAGTIMAVLVWVLIGYSSLTMTFLAKTGGVPVIAAMLYNILATLALASHVKTSLTDPGSVPAAAVPTQAQQDCVFNVVLVQLVRLVTFLSVGAFLFTSSMLMNVVYGLMTGVGTIDRLKKKAAGTMGDSEEEPIPLQDVFGISPLWQWPLPLDPKFRDYDAVMGYATPQRLLREQMRDGGESVVTRESYSVPVV
eukprot:scaffold40646_cov206-Amphora_coffeaeformis.AAC.1